MAEHDEIISERRMPVLRQESESRVDGSKCDQESESCVDGNKCDHLSRGKFDDSSTISLCYCEVFLLQDARHSISSIGA